MTALNIKLKKKTAQQAITQLPIQNSEKRKYSYVAVPKPCLWCFTKPTYTLQNVKCSIRPFPLAQKNVSTV